MTGARRARARLNRVSGHLYGPNPHGDAPLWASLMDSGTLAPLPDLPVDYLWDGRPFESAGGNGGACGCTRRKWHAVCECARCREHYQGGSLCLEFLPGEDSNGAGEGAVRSTSFGGTVGGSAGDPVFGTFAEYAASVVEQQQRATKGRGHGDGAIAGSQDELGTLDGVTDLRPAALGGSMKTAPQLLVNKTPFAPGAKMSFNFGAQLGAAPASGKTAAPTATSASSASTAKTRTTRTKPKLPPEAAEVDSLLGKTPIGTHIFGTRTAKTEPQGETIIGPKCPGTQWRATGIPSFARLPTWEELMLKSRMDSTVKVRSPDVAILGVPFDSGCTFRPGARFGPEALRTNSRLMRPYLTKTDTLPMFMSGSGRQSQAVAFSGNGPSSVFNEELGGEGTRGDAGTEARHAALAQQPGVGPAPRDASGYLRHLRNAIDRHPMQVCDAGDIHMTPFNVHHASDEITQHCRELFFGEGRYGAANAINANAINIDSSAAGASASPSSGAPPGVPHLLLLGGDHTLSYPVLKAMKEKYSVPIGLIHFDAHLDTFPPMFGQDVWHGSPFRMCWEEGLLAVPEGGRGNKDKKAGGGLCEPVRSRSSRGAEYLAEPREGVVGQIANIENGSAPPQEGVCTHVGIRSSSWSKQDIVDSESMGIATIFAEDCHEQGIARCLEVVRRRADRRLCDVLDFESEDSEWRKLLEDNGGDFPSHSPLGNGLWRRVPYPCASPKELKVPLYLSIDIDVLDPSVAPGTGTPEFGGLLAHQLLQFVRGLRGLNICGGDLVEVAPAYDHAGITALAGANIVVEILNLIGQRP